MSETEELTQLLCDLVALPSVNPESEAQRTAVPYGEARVADYVEKYLKRYGLRTRRQQVSQGRENVLGFVPGAGASPLLLEAHMDTVGVEGMDRPFEPLVEGGRVYGRGACDTKGALAAMMFALGKVVEEGVPLARGCVLAATADEEFDMAGAQLLVDAQLDLAGAIVGEPTGLQIVPAHDGQTYFRICARGKAAHTSTPHNGVNAIYVINDVIDVLRREAKTAYRDREHPLCGAPQLTVSIIHGGVSEHVVPDYCEIALDCRVIPGETCQGIWEEIRSWLEDGLDSEAFGRIELGAPYKAQPALETPSEHPLVQGLEAAAREVLGSAEIAGVPYNTDASHYGAAGIPCVVFGPGDIAQAHSTDEYVDIEQLVAASRIIKAFLVKHGDMAP
jgi:succinyl-diaminopimelate desuccinylase